MAKKEKNIESVTYNYVMTGEKDRFGRNVWSRNGEPKISKRKEKNYGDLKHNIYKSSKDNKNVYANYKDRFSVRHSKVLSSVTVKNSDGSKSVTYFRNARRK